MRILFIGTDRDLFRADSDVRRRIERYAREVEAMAVIVYARASLGFETIHPSERLTIIPTNSLTKVGYILDAVRVGVRHVRAWQRDGARCIIVSAQDPHECGVAGMLVRLFTGARLQVQVHADYYSSPYWRRSHWLNRFKSPLGLYILKRADCVRAVSERIAHTLNRYGVARDRLSVVPVRTDTSQLRTGTPSFDLHDRFPPGSVVLLTVARLVKPKNIPLLLRAFRRVVEMYPHVRLVVVGRGPLAGWLRRMVQDYMLQDKVVFEPWTDDIVSYMKTADVYVLSSDWEGWARVIIEAMACGLPAVMTDVGCAGEVFRDGVHGRVVPVRDEQAFARAVEELVGNASLRARMAERCRSEKVPIMDEDENVRTQRGGWEKCCNDMT